MSRSQGKNHWSSPHRPLQGARCEFGHIGDVLTDRKIRRYILQGRYGEEMKARLVALETSKKQKRVTPKKALRLALSELGL